MVLPRVSIQCKIVPQKNQLATSKKYETIREMKYAEIAFRGRTPGANDGLFTYAVPASLANSVLPGCLVTAPLQGTVQTALVVRVHDRQPLFDTEVVASVRSPSLVDPLRFELAARIAHKNFVPLARVLPLFLPQQIFAGNGIPPQRTDVSLLDKNVDVKGKKMQAVIAHLRESGVAELTELRRSTGTGKATIDRLHELGAIEYVAAPKFAPAADYHVQHDEGELTAEQKQAYDFLQENTEALLFAPTGSGKSHLTRKLAADALAAGSSVFFLLPEIGLTGELVAKCKTIFGDAAVAVYHSRLSEGERAETFWRIATGQARVIVGSRAALFLPFQDLGLIVMEEEHEWTYKSDQSPRYHARDVAEELARLHRARLVYATATPSLETWYRAHSRQLPVTRLPSRSAAPEFSIIDLREEVAARNTSLLSRTLTNKVTAALQNKKQALLFLNRRGIFRTLICEDCGEAMRCPDCAIALVSHAGKEGKEFLLCHQCGHVFGIPERCVSCGGSKMRFFGSGTAQIERVVKNRFPDHKVLRIDRDTTAAKSGFADLHETFASGAADILVGTQIIAKGLDFANVGVVGILDADAGLGIPDFRATERTFQLLVQVAGRAGRRGQAAEVVIQTRLPQLPLWQTLRSGNAERFYEQELALREQHFLPPASRIAKLIFSAKTKEGTFGAARKLEAILRQRSKELFPEEKIQIFVAPALHPKRHGKYFANLFVISAMPEALLRAVPLPRCRIDIDPADVVS